MTKGPFKIGRLDAVVEGNDMWVAEGFKDLDFAIEVLLQLLVKTGKFDGFDGNGGARFLRTIWLAWSSRYAGGGHSDE